MKTALVLVGLLTLLSTSSHAGTAAPKDLLSTPGIYPRRIISSAERWTFLVTGIDPKTIRKAVLVIGSREITFANRTDTGPTGSLWDFDYPAIPDTVKAAVSITAADTTLTGPLEVIVKPSSPWTCKQGDVIHVELQPHTLTWVAGKNPSAPDYGERTLSEVPCKEPILDDLLMIIGVSFIAKDQAFANDGDSTYTFASGTKTRIPPSFRSSYRLTVPDQHSPVALAEILRLSPAVRVATCIVTGR